MQADGLVGSNSTWGAEGIVSGIYDKLSLSAGYTHFETDGWRENADQNDDFANIFAQYELSYKTSIQAEYRYRDTERGDIQLRFFEDDIIPDLFQDDETKTGRLGFRHAFSPNSVFIGNFSYQDVISDSSFKVFIDPSILGFPPPDIEDFQDIDVDEEAYTGEIQHLFRSQYVNTVAGAGYFDVKQDFQLNESITWPGISPPLLLSDDTEFVDSDINHFNLYLYSYINLMKNVTLTVGASGDFFKRDEKENGGRDLDEDQFNPKFGITWKPFPNTTLRGAVFHTLKRLLTTDQTLEPTQVAGFNQFYDDPNATKAWVYGGAVDQRFSQKIYGGVALSYRDLEVPFFEFAPQPATGFTLSETEWREYLGRAYLFWTPHKWFGLSAEYLYEKLERDREFTDGIVEVKTHHFPLGVLFPSLRIERWLKRDVY